MSMTAAVDEQLAAQLFRSLGDPTRLRILLRLQGGEHRVVDLVREIGVAQATVSAHLACLRACGLVTSRPQGRQNMYAIAIPEVRVLLEAAEVVLGKVGHEVALCQLMDGAT